MFLARITKENAHDGLDQTALTDLLDALRSGGDLGFMRDAMHLVLQAPIDLEATEGIGAPRYERANTRTTHRNGRGARRSSAASPCPPAPTSTP